MLIVRKHLPWFGVFTLMFGLYVKFSCPGVYWGEGPLLSTCSASLGISHPPGYPLHLLSNRLGYFLPMGDTAWKSTMFSSCAAWLALGFAYGLGLKLGLARWAAGIMSILLGFTPTILLSATMTEVYTLNLLLTCIILTVAISGGLRNVLLVSFLFGLSLGNHVTIILLAPGLIIILLPTLRDRAGKPIRLLGMATAFFLLGLSVVMYDPLRARSSAPIRWDQPDNWRDFITLVSARDEALPSFSSSPTGALYDNLTHKLLPDLSTKRFGIPGLFLIGIGCFSSLRRSPRLTIAWFVSIAGYVIPVAAYWTNETSYFAIPATIFVTIFASMGLESLACRRQMRRSPRIGRVVAMGLIGLLLFPTVLMLTEFNRSRCYLPYDYACRLLRTASGGILITERSDLGFLLWYLQFIERREVETPCFFRHLFAFSWAVDNWKQLHPEVVFPTTRPQDFVDSPEWTGTYTFGIAMLNQKNRPIFCVEPWIMTDTILPGLGGSLALDDFLVRRRESNELFQSMLPNLDRLRLDGADFISKSVVAGQLATLHEFFKGQDHQGISNGLLMRLGQIEQNVRR